jgi:hypothetical protein
VDEATAIPSNPSVGLSSFRAIMVPIVDFGWSGPFKDVVSFTDGIYVHSPANPAILDRVFDAIVVRSAIIAENGEQYRWVTHDRRGVRAVSLL